MSNEPLTPAHTLTAAGLDPAAALARASEALTMAKHLTAKGLLGAASDKLLTLPSIIVQVRNEGSVPGAPPSAHAAALGALYALGAVLAGGYVVVRAEPPSPPTGG